jgi:hypothetical protein
VRNIGRANNKNQVKPFDNVVKHQSDSLAHTAPGSVTLNSFANLLAYHKPASASVACIPRNIQPQQGVVHNGSFTSYTLKLNRTM